MVLAAAMVSCSSLLAQDANRLKVLPLPSSVEMGQGFLALNAQFRAGFSGSHDARLDAAFDRFLTRLDQQCGDIRRSQHGASQTSAALFDVQVAGPGAVVQGVDEDESYQLKVTASQATLTAATDVGAMHGMETFLQLVEMESGGCRVRAVAIDDRPRFQWRGFMLDVIRHFEPVDEIEHTLDGMAIGKLNVFHWHLSDDQAFRAESLKFPKLTENASGGLYYTQGQLREVVAYARARGIRVVPEFDIPGHSSSTALAYPEIGSGEDLKELPIVYDAPRAELDPSNEKTYKFVDTFVGEMSEIFPDAYFHIGGDETEGKAWLANPRIKSFMEKKGFKTTAELQAYFNQRLLPILKKHGKRMVGWDEILTPELPKDIMVQSWRGEESLAQGATQGYTGILAAPYYLDAQKSAEQMFLADPVPADTKLTPEQQKLILGGEATMWAEQINPATVDSRVWPRALAIAERFWSPQSDRDVADMYRRLRMASLELEDVGLTHISGPAKHLRNLAGAMNPGALETMASVIEPVSFGDREDTQKTDGLTALNRLVDAVVADPPARQEIAREVASLVDAKSTGERASAQMQLRRRFEAWEEAAPRVEAWSHRSARLSDASARARQLGALGALGLESLAFLDLRTQPPPDWLDRQKATIKDAEQPSALVRFVMLAELEKLAQAAATQNTVQP